MYTRRLDTFLQVADLGSFSKAAQALYITPSAVIQQINSLETDLQAALFVRTSRGVRLTEAGELVYREGKALAARCAQLRLELNALQNRAQTHLCVGTSLLRKCRVFNQLWPLFRQENPAFTLEIRPLPSPEASARDVGLIESVYDGPYWDEGWRFWGLCTVPIVCAVSRRHPLAEKSRLTYADLRAYGLVTKHLCMVQELRDLYDDVTRRGIPTVEVPKYDLSVFNRCELEGYVLQLPACWRDLYPEMVILPCEWSYALRYGFFYQDEPSPPVRAFLDFVRKRQEAGALPPLELPAAP